MNIKATFARKAAKIMQNVFLILSLTLLSFAEVLAGPTVSTSTVSNLPKNATARLVKRSYGYDSDDSSYHGSSSSSSSDSYSNECDCSTVTLAPCVATTTPKGACDKGLDLVFVADMSGSIQEPNFVTMKNALIATIEKIKIGTGKGVSDFAFFYPFLHSSNMTVNLQVDLLTFPFFPHF